MACVHRTDRSPPTKRHSTPVPTPASRLWPQRPSQDARENTARNMRLRHAQITPSPPAVHAHQPHAFATRNLASESHWPIRLPGAQKAAQHGSTCARAFPPTPQPFVRHRPLPQGKPGICESAIPRFRTKEAALQARARPPVLKARQATQTPPGQLPLRDGNGTVAFYCTSTHRLSRTT